MNDSPPTPRRRSYGGVSPETRQQLRRERLIEAGIEAFGVHGFHAVTVREICAEAKLTERYFYESFQSLEALFTAVYSKLNLELKQATMGALARAPQNSIKLAEDGLRVFFEYVRNDPRRARILLIESISIGQNVHRLANESARDFTDLMRGFISALFPDAVARGVKADLLSAGLIGANIHIATQWVREDFRTPLDDVLFNNMMIYRAMFSYWGAGPVLRAKAARNSGGKRSRPARPHRNAGKT
jgi:AcrR family transcriptional regulator